MIDSLSDLLGKRPDTTPPEISRIKKYIQKQYEQDVSIAIHKTFIGITTPSAAFANALRLDLPQLVAAANTDKKIVIKIG